jgi:2-polyprenyl-6-methoxyphenol hydroxylase-like FAD-dependent oxidoreductase
MRVLIVGAGISGLSAAIALEKIGIIPRIIEKYNALRYDGAGIALPSNAVACLFSLGLKDALLKQAHLVKNIIYALPNEEILSVGSLTVPVLNKYPFVALQRKALIDLLVKNIKSKIEFNKTIISFKQNTLNNESTITFNDKENCEFDLIIAADGINSSLRQLSIPIIPDDLGLSTWRFIANFKQKDPIYFFGKNSTFMIYPISDTQVYCYAHMLDLKKICSACKNALSIIFSEYPTKVRWLINSVTQKDIIFGRLISVKNPILCFNNIAFIGDSSHACSPMLQQGAAAAFEDVLTLTHLLKSYPNIKDVLNHYEKIRSPRIQWIKDHSDNPIKNMSSSITDEDYRIRNEHIKVYGPVNITNWKILLAEEYDQLIYNYFKSQKSPRITSKL